MALNTKQKLDELRKLMALEDLQAYIVPHSDEHQSEYLDHYAERLAWLTDFTGSAGSAIILGKKAAIFVDGRYTLQAAKQVDQGLFEIVPIAEETPEQWLAKNLIKEDRVGVDAWLHTEIGIQRLEKLCKNKGATLSSLDENLIDKLWHDQPKPSSNKAFIHDLKYSGVSHQKKIKQIAADLKDKNIDYVVISSLPSVCWLLNIRGHDVEYTPVVFAYVIIEPDETVHLFIDHKKLTPDVIEHLDAQIKIHDKFEIEEFLKKIRASANVQIDPKNTPYMLIETLIKNGVNIIRDQDPCMLPSACKNAIEIQGVKAAHIRDGVAVCNFLSWLETNLKEGYKLTEMDAVKTLLEFRREQELFVSESFATISGSGPNGAIVHYRVDKKSNRLLNQDSIFLVDSGGQYYDGTTDVTRVVAIKDPTAEQKDRFTKVLKGHIDLARVVFPVGTSGSQLDVLARFHLWRAGLDYAHGTGHGVGSFLGVHDGPQSISKSTLSVTPLCAGMVLSNEPGYYKEGEYGFRVESLMLVHEVHIPHSELSMLGFETITMIPIEQKLIDLTIMHRNELRWLNDYHSEIREKLLPLVKDETKDWLIRATEKLN